MQYSLSLNLGPQSWCPPNPHHPPKGRRRSPGRWPFLFLHVSAARLHQASSNICNNRCLRLKIRSRHAVRCTIQQYREAVYTQLFSLKKKKKTGAALLPHQPFSKHVSFCLHLCISFIFGKYTLVNLSAVFEWKNSTATTAFAARCCWILRNWPNSALDVMLRCFLGSRQANRFQAVFSNSTSLLYSCCLAQTKEIKREYQRYPFNQKWFHMPLSCSQDSGSTGT